MRQRLLAVGLIFGVVALLALPGCIPTEEATAERTGSFAVGEGAIDLEIVSSNGRVSIVGIDGLTTVEVTATLRSRGETLAEATVRVAQIDVQMTQDGNRIILRYDASAHPFDVRRHSGVDFEVTVPALANIEATTSNGRIEVREVAGILRLDTSNARIEVADVVADLRANTSNNRIRIERFEGILELDTSNGRIEMEDVDGVVNAETSNAGITFSGMLIPDVAHRMVTSNAQIHLAIRSDASLIIDAETSNASIVSSLPLVGDTDGREWFATLNPPAAGTLTLRTSNGQITMHGIFQ